MIGCCGGWFSWLFGGLGWWVVWWFGGLLVPVLGCCSGASICVLGPLVGCGFWCDVCGWCLGVVWLHVGAGFACGSLCVRVFGFGGFWVAGV